MNKEKNCVRPEHEHGHAERRTSSRIDVELSVKLQRGEDECGTYAASNVSAGGLYLRGNFKSIFPGDVLSVSFIDISKQEITLRDMRALVLSRNAGEGRLTWLDCDSLFWMKLLKLLACASNDANPPLNPEILLRDCTNQ